MRRWKLFGLAAVGAALLAIAMARPPARENTAGPRIALPNRFETLQAADPAVEASVLRLVRGVSLGSGGPPRPPRSPAALPPDLSSRTADAPPTAVPEPPLVALALAYATCLHARACLRRAR